MRLGLMIIALLCLAGGPALASVDRGLEAYQASDYASAFEQWAVDAEDGDPVAQFLLGHLYESGLGVAADPVEAYQWYDLAASQDYEEALVARDRVAAGMTEAQLELVQGSGETAATESSLSAEEALLDAVLRDDVARIAELLAAGGDPDLRFADGDPILLEAARQGRAGIVLTLIGAGAEIDEPGDSDWTALMAAVYADQNDLAAILLRQGADPFAEASDGVTAYDLAVERDQQGVLALIGESSEIAGGESPGTELLLAAAEAGDLETVISLIDAGAELDAADGDGWTALMFAAVAGHLDVARTLIEVGARVDAAAEDGATALMMASLGKRAQMVRLLLASGAKAGHRAKSGATALQIAEQNGSSEIAELLRARLGPPPKAVAEVQSLLSRLGYAPGPVDGAMGPKTRGAITAFQRDRGFKADGRVSAALLSNLRDVDASRIGGRAAETAWAELRDSRNPAALLAFAAEHPDSGFATEARNRANLLAVALMRSKTPVTQAPARTAEAIDARPVQEPAYRQTAAQQTAIRQMAAQQAVNRPAGVSRRSARRDTQAGTAPGISLTGAAIDQPSNQERADWATVMGRGQASDFAAYLEAYPNGAFTQQAHYMLQQQAAPQGAPPRSSEPAPRDLSAVTQYLQRRPQLFHGQVNAYNKRNRVVASGNQATYKVREIYEAVPVGLENGAFKVEVLMGVGNWQDSENNAGLNIERVVLYLNPQGDRFEIVGHTKDLG